MSTTEKPAGPLGADCQQPSPAAPPVQKADVSPPRPVQVDQLHPTSPGRPEGIVSDPDARR